MNGWTCTDASDYQYQKKLSATVFAMIQVIEISNNTWTIVADTIDIEEYSEEEIESYVVGYYESLDELIKEYKKCSNGVIAECIFECTGFGDYELEETVITEAQAVDFIYRYINKE